MAEQNAVYALSMEQFFERYDSPENAPNLIGTTLSAGKTQLIYKAEDSFEVMVIELDDRAKELWQSAVSDFESGLFAMRKKVAQG